ncbi:hypothetical protein [Leuconostoc citreum]|uniref:hypothetical protein n=1 Tax=Leuconostoc citreum TaxID=33964 RepID=UPI0032DF50A8
MIKKEIQALNKVIIDDKPYYPGLANQIMQDPIYGPRIDRRIKRLLNDRPDGLARIGHHWYFGYLVCAYTQTHYGIKTLLNYSSVTEEIFDACLLSDVS